MSASVWDDVVGQGPAIEQLDAAIAAGPLHAYLFVGPAGSTKDEAARAFAALLLTGVDDPTQRDAHLVLRGEHPDVREVRRTGARIGVEPAKYIAEKAALSPIESDHKVLILHEFHLLEQDGAAILLKTIEEPPPSTTFIILADDAPAELETIWSRSVAVRFMTIPEQVITARLVAEGVGPGVAKASAAMAYGDLDRARLLATDPAVADRRSAFTAAPQRLDGTGNTALTLTAEILDLIDAAAEPLKQQHAEELQALEDRVEQLGERGAGRKDLTDRQRRELRRHRTDELRAGLASLAATYRDALVGGTVRDPVAATDAVHRIHGAIEATGRNANERLLLESLFWSLPSLRG